MSGQLGDEPIRQRLDGVVLVILSTGVPWTETLASFPVAVSLPAVDSASASIQPLGFAVEQQVGADVLNA